MEPRTSREEHTISQCLMDVEKMLEPKRLVNASAACRNSVVLMALSLSDCTVTSVNDLLIVSKKVPPGGYVRVADMIVCMKIVLICLLLMSYVQPLEGGAVSGAKDVAPVATETHLNTTCSFHSRS